MGSISTKENLKGYTRSYNYRRKSILAICLLTAVSYFSWKLYITRRDYGQLPPLKVGTIADHPIRSVEYGMGRSTPVVMIRSSLDEPLHERFLEEHLYSCLEAELNNGILSGQLDNRVAAPVYVYEGYYHGLPTIGTDFDKPAASAFTRAFFHAFRAVNNEIFDTLSQGLLDASSFNSTMKEDVCYVLAKWIERGFHFADLSVQIHYGRGNEEKLTSGRAWHTDAENSLLHLAVTLRGTRVLHSRRIRSHSNSTLLRRPNGVDGEEQQKMAEVLERQEPGDVYLSSSTLMRHAPRFFDTDYSTRSIAIHARILYTSADVEHFRRVRTKESWDRMTEVLANTLAAANIRIPSLAQVESRLLLLPSGQ